MSYLTHRDKDGILFRIHATEQGWELEIGQERSGIYYPTWSEAYFAYTQIESELARASTGSEPSGSIV